MTGCPSDDSFEVVVRPYSEVYAEDIAKIETFLDTHYTTVDANYNVTFTKITSSTPGTPISDELDTSVNQDNDSKKLKHKIVSVGGVDHKLYFLKLNEGSGGTSGEMQPTRLDSILPAYKGYILDDLSVFDVKNNADKWFELPSLIQAWQQVFPEFKAGDDNPNNPDGTSNFTNFGAGVMFVPSGLAYFNQINTGINSYSTLIFSFKLMKVRFKDHDGDKILSKDEYGGPTTGTALDSDGDGKPDYGDYDDDNDGKVTFEEIRTAPGASSWYPFGSIPICSPGGNGKPRHLDPSCK